MKGIEQISIWASYFPFDVLFRKKWLNAPNGTQTHVSWSLVRRENHYTTVTQTLSLDIGLFRYIKRPRAELGLYT